MFEAWVTQAVERALEQPHVNFAALTARLPGIYPQQVLRALQVLDDREPRLDGIPTRLIQSACEEIVVPSAPSGLLGLPPPHPLDFEWRFAPKAIDAIANVAATLTPAGSSIALVGTPTFASTRACALQSIDIDYFGLDSNLLTSLGLTACLRDVRTVDLLMEPAIASSYQTVVMDPPWYDDHIRRFIYFAQKALLLDGHLLLAMPASGTRPGIEDENARALAWAERLGFALECIERGTVPYETPPFERNALRATGILNVGAEWRRGDLWILRKRSCPLVDWPGDISSTRWMEYRSGPVRVRIDITAARKSRDASLRSVVDGDVLASVSRRDPRRAEVRVWTTANRIFACDAPVEFAAMVNEWLSTTIRQDSSDDIGGSARAQFFSLIERERADLAWPTERPTHCPTR